MSKVLGIDQSFKNTGWCVTVDGKLTAHGMIHSPKELDKFTRMHWVGQRIEDLIIDHLPDIVSLEGLPFGTLPGNSSKDLAGLQAVVGVYIIVNEGYPLGDTLFLPPPTSVKLFATGSGKASKEDMVEALPDDVKELFNKVPISKGRHDLADAYWLALFGEKKGLERGNC